MLIIRLYVFLSKEPALMGAPKGLSVTDGGG
jgi:hypothetical protein